MNTDPVSSVDFDEFSRACDLVEEYFGTTIDAVALNAPVSRRQLVAVLARAQLTGRQMGVDELVAKGGPVHESEDEILFWLENDFWSTMRERHHLAPDEGRAAREVHRRIIEAIDGDVSYYNRDRDPYVLIERQLLGE